jgi:uncharacterized membrane protein YhaH (DUF805 family)
MNWYLKVLRQYVDFSGRARRKEFWMFALFNIIFGTVAVILDEVYGTTFGIESMHGVFDLIYSLAVLLPGLAVGIRRLHDIGKSGWYCLFALIPIVGWIILLIWYCEDSQAGENRWGVNPKDESKATENRYCVNCGKQIEYGSRFCTHCGANLTDNSLGIQGFQSTPPSAPSAPANLLAVFGNLCCVFAIVDFTGMFMDYDLTGVSWSPIVFGIIGTMLIILEKRSSYN